MEKGEIAEMLMVAITRAIEKATDDIHSLVADYEVNRTTGVTCDAYVAHAGIPGLDYVVKDDAQPSYPFNRAGYDRAGQICMTVGTPREIVTIRSAPTPEPTEPGYYFVRYNDGSPVPLKFVQVVHIENQGFEAHSMSPISGRPNQIDMSCYDQWYGPLVFKAGGGDE